ncbi:YidH family protein [Tardiphaga sp. 20_F10_N6_6]|uniref:YidH family protein n=1 Tax=Tardiphaga sp. 20_F10_N6_6 TaxID=3240788 RepID=UPI003F8873DF
MIKNFREHAANERTFLAWVRTAIAVMAFGFLLARYEFLFIQENPTPLAQIGSHDGYIIGDLAGIASIAMGTIIFVLAIIRFVRTSRDIDVDTDRSTVSVRTDIVLACLLTLIGLMSIYYVSRALTIN